jgi:hypothetical protein
MVPVLFVGGGLGVIMRITTRPNVNLAVAAIRQAGGAVETSDRGDGTGRVVGVNLVSRGSDAILELVAQIGQLEKLGAEGSPITDAGLARLGPLAGLRRINLRGTKITDAGLRHLTHFSQLEVLDIGDTNVSDDGLAHLAGLAGLSTLRLHRTRVTDAGLVHLQTLRGLHYLDLSGTEVVGGGLCTSRGFAAWVGLTSATPWSPTRHSRGSRTWPA